MTRQISRDIRVKPPPPPPPEHQEFELKRQKSIFGRFLTNQSFITTSIHNDNIEARKERFY